MVDQPVKPFGGDLTIHERLGNRTAVTGYHGHNPAIYRLFPSEGISTVLDVGCGRGGNASQLLQRGLTVDGVSWLPQELAAAQQFCRRVIECDLSDGIPQIDSNAYDCVICSHVLEHIAYPERMLMDIRRGLVPSGYLIVAIPNLFFWSDRIKLIMGRWEYRESGTFDYTHLRWYTRASLQQLLFDNGFLCDGFFAEGWAPLPTLKFIVGKRLRARINQLACILLPGLFGQQLVFRFRKVM